MYKMYEEGEQYFIDLVDSQEELEYDGFIRDKKIESIIEVWIISNNIYRKLLLKEKKILTKYSEVQLLFQWLIMR